MLKSKPEFAGFARHFCGRGLDLKPEDFQTGIHQQIVREVVAQRLGNVEALFERAVGKELLSGSPYCFGGEDRKPCNLS